MPLIETSTYRRRGLFRSGHLQTVLPTLLRTVPGVRYQRQRLILSDGDFVDLDWSRIGSGQVAVLCHGLEGSTDAHYMRGMTRALNDAGWEVVGFNFRGCSGEPNLHPRFYHSGATEDLAEVIDAVRCTGAYGRIALVGFSLGGNLVLKYLGERRHDYPAALLGAVAVSVPCDLGACARRLEHPVNRVYQHRFLRMLKAKVRAKRAHRGPIIDTGPLGRIGTVTQFDDAYTAPLNGFANAADYYARCSALHFLSELAAPALLLTAADDPLLTESCYPRETARRSSRLTLELTRHGGHVGFVQHHPAGHYWHERRALSFLDALGGTRRL